ncbi:MAG: TerC family protein [Flavobacteriales bacterium]|nr:TerC family protein [Flavobacteriales bacterium]MBK6945896.1 TerC family protein [Flavobacteriales bacterium]MBK7239169.1 TerC family protein [Flavobacteriales bacterium]MBK7296639.1 TerC family protein [Flavobacteriales bacterium]MBK9536727.1 TerC family protein [Flavobacteriales bacterium]
MIDFTSLDFAVLLTSHGLIALFTLTVLEIVLGIDNIIFISIISNTLSTRVEQRKARQIGLALAMITRVLLLLSLSWVMGLNETLFTLFGHDFSGRDLVLILGGLFLIYKATVEVHSKVTGHDEDPLSNIKKRGMAMVISQIVVVDIVFSLDSVITAVGMSNEIVIMVLAVIIAVVVMMVAATTISDFVEDNPTVKVLALAFLLMIGVALLIEGMGEHINKNYIYFAMGFSVLVETLNLRMMKNRNKTIMKERADQEAEDAQREIASDGREQGSGN